MLALWRDIHNNTVLTLDRYKVFVWCWHTTPIIENSTNIHILNVVQHCWWHDNSQVMEDPERVPYWGVSLCCSGLVNRPHVHDYTQMRLIPTAHKHAWIPVPHWRHHPIWDKYNKVAIFTESAHEIIEVCYPFIWVIKLLPMLIAPIHTQLLGKGHIMHSLDR